MGKLELSHSDDHDHTMELDLDLTGEDIKTKNSQVQLGMENVHPTQVDGSPEALPNMVLKVLLVEADDSTRRIIAALLRKCSYRVYAVPDGLKAWEALIGRPRNIDLILTEVDLPSISGYALLTLVMEHDIYKNIPVIMMSSCDTVSMVLKCMLKGAADFLIKPIRKNELRNLWQHVWRRHTIVGKIPINVTGGQGKVEGTSNNEEASNHSGDYAALRRKIMDCSEKGSDAQSSCTAPYFEAESGCMPNMQDVSPSKDGTIPNLHMDFTHGNSTCLDKDFDTRKSNLKEKPDNAAKIEACNSTSSRVKDGYTFAELRNQNLVVRPEFYRVNADSTCEINGYINEWNEPSGGVIDLIGKFGDTEMDIDRVCQFDDNHDGAYNCIDTSTIKIEFSPPLELSLRRTCPGKSTNHGNGKARALNHSNASAFSSYSSGKMMKPPSIVLYNAPTKSETSASLPSLLSGNSGCTSQEHGVPASNSQHNLSTRIASKSDLAEHLVQRAEFGLLPVPDLIFDKPYAGHVLPSMFDLPSGFPGMLNTRSTCQQEHSLISVNASFQNFFDNSNSRLVHHQCEETTNNTIDRVSGELKHDSSAAPHSASSSLCNGADHINSNACGSICGETDGNTSSTLAVEKLAPSENLNSTNIFSREGCKGLISHHSRHREAAVEKFRLKRKDRCYEKKVRYESRKRLAEQRPRVKGQFVRQQPTEAPPVSDAGCQ